MPRSLGDGDLFESVVAGPKSFEHRNETVDLICSAGLTCVVGIRTISRLSWSVFATNKSGPAWFGRWLGRLSSRHQFPPGSPRVLLAGPEGAAAAARLWR